MAFVRFLNILIKDKQIGPRVVPIVPDESRTFGMEGIVPTAWYLFTHWAIISAGRFRTIMHYHEAKKAKFYKRVLMKRGRCARGLLQAHLIA